MIEDLVSIRKALISVSDKSGLEKLCKELHSWGTELYATGGTGQALESWGIPFTPLEHYTQSPEFLGGRVKTLHPKVFGGILGRRNEESDLSDISREGIKLFDLVVVNLYPFEENSGRSIEESTEYVDIGGSALMRAAAKNHRWVTVLSDPTDYPEFLEDTGRERKSSAPFRFTMARRTFLRASRYDRMIYDSWSGSYFPTQIDTTSQIPLRYGEDPHQKAAFSGSPQWSVLSGKELSYNNLLDSEAAASLVSEFDGPALAIIKHGNPCGVAWGLCPSQELFKKAFQTDSKSAFGGVLATNQPINKALAESLFEYFLEVIVAPQFESEGLELLKTKKNLRLIEWTSPSWRPFEVRPAMGGWLIQDRDPSSEKLILEPFAGEIRLEKEAIDDIDGALKVCKYARSNAIVIAKKGATVGIGAGQVSRIDALEIAILKAGNNLSGAVLVSDAFFPFRDSIDRLGGLGHRLS